MNRICAETGTVIARKDEGRVVVLIRRTEACESCEGGEICAAFRTESGDVTLILENTLEAEVGDEVVVALIENTSGRVSAATVIVPALNLVLGGFVGVGIASFLHTDKDTAVLIGGGLGLSVGLFLNGRFGGHAPPPVQYVPVLSEIKRRVSSMH